MTFRARPRSGRLLLWVAVGCALLWVFRYPALKFGGKLVFPYPYRHVIEREARRAHVDPLLVVAVMRQESGFSTRARSHAGAIGLMQLMPHTARWVAQRLKEPLGDLEEPRTNIHLGVSYLGYLDRLYNGDLARVLAAYDGGQGNVRKWHDLSKAFPETRHYVQRGLRTYAIYRWLYGSSDRPTPIPSSAWASVGP